MINNYLILIYALLPFVATSFWESSVEGRKAWDKGKVGWKISIGRYVFLTRYRFWLNIMIILFLLFPLIIFGWNFKLFGVLLSAYFLGFVIEDFLWYVFNPVVKFKEFSTRFANYYPRIRFGKIYIPVFYFACVFLAFLSWWFIWK